MSSRQYLELTSWRCFYHIFFYESFIVWLKIFLITVQHMKCFTSIIRQGTRKKASLEQRFVEDWYTANLTQPLFIVPILVYVLPKRALNLFLKDFFVWSNDQWLCHKWVPAEE